LRTIAWLGELMTKSGLPDPRRPPTAAGAIWGKFIFNSVMNPIGAVVQGVNAARYDVPEMRALIDAMAAECIRVAEALGIRLEFDPMYLVKKIRAGESRSPQHARSMGAGHRGRARDRARGDDRCYIVKKAKVLGVPAPVTRAIYRMAKGVEYAAREAREG